MKTVNSKKEYSEMKYCNKCNVDVIPVNDKCPNCGLDFNLNSVKEDITDEYINESNFDINERHVNTRLYKRIAIILLFLGFVGGIIVGKEYGVCSDYLSNCTEKEFNGELMLYCWGGTILFNIFVFGIHSICYRLDLLIDKK